MTTATEVHGWRPADSLANRLRLVRAEKKMSQREAAEACGISARVWQNAEDGRSIRDERAALAAIALAFGLDRDWLTWGGALNDENPRPEGPDGGDATNGLRIKSPKLFQLSYRGERDFTNVVPLHRQAVAA